MKSQFLRTAGVPAGCSVRTIDRFHALRNPSTVRTYLRTGRSAVRETLSLRRTRFYCHLSSFDMETTKAMLDRLIEDGVASPEALLEPLRGGVSSEIYLVTDRENRFVVKRALEKLNVAQEWYADVSRNQSEFDYIEYVSRFAPDSVPVLKKKGTGYFTMEYLGMEYSNWKTLLLNGVWQEAHARMAGALLASVHTTSRGDPEAEKHFDNAHNFWELRLEPYLMATGARHLDLEALFRAEATRLADRRECLVHGDFSPKNILISGGRLVALDCEVANYGDPVFDYCFLLTHLLLKARWHASKGQPLRPLVEAFIGAYQNGALLSDVQARRYSKDGGQLLAMLLLARVDGKSPVEYFNDEGPKDFVRTFVYRALREGECTVESLVEKWFATL